MFIFSYKVINFDAIPGKAGICSDCVELKEGEKEEKERQDHDYYETEVTQRGKQGNLMGKLREFSGI